MVVFFFSIERNGKAFFNLMDLSDGGLRDLWSRDSVIPRNLHVPPLSFLINECIINILVDYLPHFVSSISLLKCTFVSEMGKLTDVSLSLFPPPPSLDFCFHRISSKKLMVRSLFTNLYLIQRF